MLNTTQQRMAEHLSKQNLLFLLFFLAAHHANDAATQPAKHCLTKCGHVSIPFPFGTTTDCSLDTNFLINCINNVPYLLPLSGNNDTVLILLSISLDDAELSVSSPVASDCYSIDDQGKISHIQTDQFLFSGNFSISWTRNTFTAIGCNTLGVVVAFTLEDSRHYPATCFSYCEKLEHASNGSCSGSGCCRVSIPRAAEGRLRLIGYYFENNEFNNSQVSEFNPCSYVFLVEEGGYEFETIHLKKLENSVFPVVLDWSIGDQTCVEAMKNPSSFACKAENSTCHDSNKRPGYVCKCPSGFQGNPYLLHGCQQDIDECAGPNDCFHEAKCENTPGSYNCLCPEGFEGDGKNNGTRCTISPKSSYRTKTTLIYSLCFLGISIGILALVVSSFYVHWKVNKRKLIKLKEQYFQQNGGFLLQEHIAKHRSSSQIAKVFTIEELRKATNNFDACKILGQGGQGTVYKGVLSNNKTIAIKKSKISGPSQINKDFINELVVLSQINHRNVVKLLGCCLETEIPLLVYEFIPNGTVYEHLHSHGTFLIRLTWKTRLRIAAETSRALAYLHLDTCIPIIHRDVKTSNILLDHDLTAKVSDFGASRIVPQDKIELATLVQGTCGYLDPETFLTSKLTDKSDVYSFGVVLAELLTGRKALSFDMPDAEKNLAVYFVSSMEENNCLLDIVDKSIINEAKVEHVYEFAKIAKQCLSSKGEERPTMKEVAMELEGLRADEKHTWCPEMEELPSEETEILLKASPSISNNLEEEYFMLLDPI